MPKASWSCLLILTLWALQSTANATSYYRKPVPFEQEFIGAFAISSPTLVAVDGNWKMLGIEAGTLIPAGWLMNYQKNHNIHGAETLAGTILMSGLAFHLGYPFWSLVQGHLGGDEGRVQRALPVAGLMLLGVAAQIRDMQPRRSRGRFQDLMGLEVAPWPGKDVGIVATLDF